MCDHSPNREAAMVVIAAGIWCDPCLVPLVAALNDAGMPTVASCCGHGEQASSVALADGRWVLVMDDATYRAMDTRTAPVDESHPCKGCGESILHCALEGGDEDSAEDCCEVCDHGLPVSDEQAEEALNINVTSAQLLGDDTVRGGKWAGRDLFASDADVTVYWPEVRPCYDSTATIRADAEQAAARGADPRWNTAVDWLVNKVASDEGVLFWAFYDEVITETELRNEVAADLDPDGFPRNIVDVINERREVKS